VDEIGQRTSTKLKIIEAYRIIYFISKQKIISPKLSTLEMHKNLICYVKYMKLTVNTIWNNFLRENMCRLSYKIEKKNFGQTRTTVKEKGITFLFLPNVDILVKQNYNSEIMKIKSFQNE